MRGVDKNELWHLSAHLSWTLESTRKHPRYNKFKGRNHGQSSGSGREVLAFSPQAVKQK